MPRDERSLGGPRLSEFGPGDAAVPRPLVEGEMTILGLLPGASNATLLARCTAAGDEVLAVYKPERGEAPLWDFPDGTLHRFNDAAPHIQKRVRPGTRCRFRNGVSLIGFPAPVPIGRQCPPGNSLGARV